MPVADNAGLGLGILAIGHQLPREFAFRVIRAPDEGAEFAKLQAQPPACAVRAASHQGAVIVLFEEMRAKLFIQYIDDVGDRQFGGAVDGRLEVTPEPRQQRFPVKFAV